jgi:hypothetical protein
MENMINEEQNKGFHWKNKLDELENVPGKSFNKEASWNKLHSRLSGNVGKKKVVWYWAAASILFFVIIFPFLVSRTTVEPKVVKIKKPAINHNEIILKPATDDKNNIVRNDVSVSPEKERGIALMNQKTHLTIVNAVTKKIGISESGGNDLTAQTILNSLQPIDTFSNIAIHLPQKKKLQVVHINELGDPLIAEPAIARNSERHSFQMKFASQEVFINPSVASRISGIITLKTSTSPN